MTKSGCITTGRFMMRTKDGSSSAVMQIISVLFPPAVIDMDLRDETIPKSRRDTLLMRRKISGHPFPGRRFSSVWSNFLKRFLFFKPLFRCCRKQMNLPLLHTPVLSSNTAI